MKLGILGAGHIAETMAKTVHQMQKAGQGHVELYAVASRNMERAQQFAKQNGVEKAFGSYEEMLCDSALDIVYVATPHSHHSQHMKLCIQHGKHVLCEKAFTGNAAQAAEVLQLAKERGVLVTEAIWTRYQPMRKIIYDLVWSGIVGTPTTLTANLAYAISDKERLKQPDLAGGALLDIGIYGLNFAEMVFDRPDGVHATCIKTDTGVDRQESVTLTWEDGRMAVITSSICGISDRKGIIYCTKGFFIVENINNPQSITAYDTNYQVVQHVDCPPQLTGYEYEVLEAERALAEGKTECASMPHADTLHMMELMDEIRRQFGVRYPFDDTDCIVNSAVYSM
ncbi:MAG: Gfo/Idh/MocA family oxidoreductase [Lachnospiraceae bacterium]|nr:Gfo/Idh/MocA family oxidoreductase [Lachnospiraceae bacterium]